MNTAAEPGLLRASPVAAAIRRHRLIAVLRRVEPLPRLIELVDELFEDGIRVFEVTFDSTDPAAALRAVRESAGGDALVGAGTIRSTGQLRAAIDAGAAFGVAPILDPAILAAALDAGLPFVPGAYTPTEVDGAWRAGATFVKLFPASSLGASHIRELRGPLPEIEVIATGGIDEANAGAVLDAGAVAVGVGSALGRMSRAERRSLVAIAAADRGTSPAAATR